MKQIVRISDFCDIGDLFQCMVDIYGKEVFKNKRRVLACFLDMAPGMEEEFHYMETFCQLDVFTQFMNNTNEAEGKKLVKTLVANGIPNEYAIEAMEGFAKALGKTLGLRPDYTKGGTIPYVLQSDAPLDQAIASLDHIRWFLNHEKEYHFFDGQDELKRLRKMMGNPSRYTTEINDCYGQLVRRFQNDPFQEGFLIDKSETKTGFISSNFGSYFVVYQNNAVPVAFAMIHGEQMDGNRLNLPGKKQNLVDRLNTVKKNLKTHAPKNTKGVSESVKILNKKLLAQCLALLVSLVYLFFNGAGSLNLARGIDMIRINGLSILFQNYNLVYYLFILLTIFQLVALLLSARKIIKLSSGKKQIAASKKNVDIYLEALNVVEKEIPATINQLEKDLTKYLSSNGGKPCNIPQKNYREQIKKGTQVDPSSGNIPAISVKLGIPGIILIAVAVIGMLGSRVGLENYKEIAETNLLTTAKVVRPSSDMKTVDLYDQLGVKNLSISGSGSSSALHGKNKTYSSSKIRDSKLQTSWQEGVKGVGVGEYVYLKLHNVSRISHILLWLGNWNSEESYRNNGVPSKLKIEVEGNVFYYEGDTYDISTILFELPYPVIGNYIKITILDAVEGNKTKDTCISEVKVLGQSCEGNDKKHEGMMLADDALFLYKLPVIGDKENLVVDEETGVKYLDTQKEVGVYNSYYNVTEDNPYDLIRIGWAQEHGFLTKQEDDKFFYNKKNVTKGMLVQWIWELAGSPSAEGTEVSFKDVDSKNKYYEAIQWAIKEGLIADKKEDLGVNKNVTRAELYTILWKLDGQPSEDGVYRYSNVSSGSSSYEGLCWANARGLLRSDDGAKLEFKTGASIYQVIDALYASSASNHKVYRLSDQYVFINSKLAS